jgi:hypothetical protein
MKEMKKIFLFFAVALLFFACKKQALQPGSTTNPTQFYFNGIVNGSPVSLTAGLNNYYMYSSYTQDGNNVYNFTASMHQVSCSNCTNSIQFIINDDTASTPNASIASRINTALRPANYPFMTPTGGTPTSFSVQYTPVKVGTDNATNYHYVFSDGSSATTTAATYTHVYQTPGSFLATLITTFSISSPDTAKNTTQTVASNTLNMSCNKIYMDTSSGLVTIQDSLQAPKGPAYNVSWNFGDNNGPYITHYGGPTVVDTATHKYHAAGYYKVTATATDANFDTSVNTLKIPVYFSGHADSSLPSTYISQLKSVVTPQPNPTAFSNITINYTDGSGNTYSSAGVTQPKGSSFQIITVSSYQNNENNQTTKMLHIKFNAQLKGTAGTITITNGDAVVAVAYK